jgi:hypothetical protein
MALFNSENAPAMAAKAHAARRLNRAIAATVAGNHILQILAINPQNGDESQVFVRARLAYIRQAIERTEQLLGTAEKPGDRLQLARTLDMLLDRERILAGRPLPGSRRPASDEKGSRGVELMNE